MKKLIVGMFVASLVAMSSLIISNQAEAVVIIADTDAGFLNGTLVGEVDPFIAAITSDQYIDAYGNAGNPETELLWVKDVIDPASTEYLGFKIEDGNVSDTFFDTNTTDVVAAYFGDGNEPDYYLLKFGQGQGGADDSIVRILWENVADLSWAVIQFGDYQAILDDYETVDFTFNIDLLVDVSHITGFGGTSVPEPTTMLLFGSGLVGLMLYGRKRSRKEADKTS